MQDKVLEVVDLTVVVADDQILYRVHWVVRMVVTNILHCKAVVVLVAGKVAVL